jgi:DNA-binding NarL/FixJ family response regulator
VQNHVSNIYGKLGLASRAEAVLYAIRHGIADVSEVEKP